MQMMNDSEHIEFEKEVEVVPDYNSNGSGVSPDSEELEDKIPIPDKKRTFPAPIKYSSFKEIEHDLKRLSLERQIALEELKGIKYEFKEDLRPAGWLDSVVSYISRLGGVILLRKLFFRK